MSDNQKWSILQGDALKVLGTFAPNTFDAAPFRWGRQGPAVLDPLGGGVVV